MQQADALPAALERCMAALLGAPAPLALAREQVGVLAGMLNDGPLSAAVSGQLLFYMLARPNDIVRPFLSYRRDSHRIAKAQSRTAEACGSGSGVVSGRN